VSLPKASKPNALSSKPVVLLLRAPVPNWVLFWAAATVAKPALIIVITASEAR
jgi:hypothetical protein